MKRIDTAPRNKHYRCLEYDYDQGGELYLISCGVERCDPGAVTGPGIRDGYHLHVVLSGTGTLQAGGQVFHPHSGQMFLLKHGEKVFYQADGIDPWAYCWVTYNGSQAKEMSEKIGFTDGVYCLDLRGSGEEFFELVRRMYRKPEMNYPNDLMRRGILLEFIALALENSNIQHKRELRHYPFSSEAYVRRAVEFIHHNYASIDVGDIVAYVGFTRSYFTTIFKRFEGVSPQEFLIQYRIQKSCEWLTDTTMTVQEIALKVGYDNPLSFSRIFKKTCGISPTEYRQQHTEPLPTSQEGDIAT